ncbi:hypothetical protein [Actinocatenispora comari]|uniref:Uncharacterized protein n=1 Tax=Actinocatenispora comari TaxID=2807577 RepID=A0A8J4EM32_9ACTN|nr:hypothetical protein [Actinocatenispora comari]GIL29932.1 hypothetical protein NUM_51860 [Actinocatenispora comari]
MTVTDPDLVDEQLAAALAGLSAAADQLAAAIRELTDTTKEKTT